MPVYRDCAGRVHLRLKLKSSGFRNVFVLIDRRRVHFLFAVLMCGIVFLLRFVISTVNQLSDVHSSHMYLALLFPNNLPIYSLTL